MERNAAAYFLMLEVTALALETDLVIAASVPMLVCYLPS